MKIVIPQLEVKEDDAFKNDQLNRKPFGEALYKLVKESSDDGLVISINAKWGEGKTTFIKMWQGLLKENNIHSIYIDAFKEDYIEDAFLSIASTIVSYAKEYAKDEVARNLGEKVVTAAKHIAPILVKLAACRIFGTDALGIVQSDLEKDKSSYIDKMLISHKKSIENINSFKKELSNLPSHLNGATGNSNLVIIIDELDRCRPTFAIELIEKIKHMFSVKNIIFVLVMHKEQLEKSIKCVYGVIDAHTYLQKFINVETSLPEKYSLDKSIDKRYIAYIYDSLEIEMEAEDKEFTIDFISYMAQHLKLSLRQIEKAFTNISIILTINDKLTISGKLLLGINLLLCMLKIYNVDLFKRCAEKEYNNLIDDLKIPMEEEDFYNRFMRGCIIYYTKKNDEISKIEISTIPAIYKPSIHIDQYKRLSVIPTICQQLSTFTI